MNCPKAIRKGSSGKVMRLTDQLKCLYTNSHIMENKQEELETMVQVDKYDLTTIVETWWDGSQNWNTGIEG